MVRRYSSLPFLRFALALGLAPGLAACNGPRMTATANLASLRPEAATLAMVGVSGPSEEQGQRFAAIFAQEARSRGFVVAEPNVPVATTRMHAYLDSFTGADGRPAISYVLQTSVDGRTRTHRVSGMVPANAPGWAGLDDGAMRRVAAASLDDLTRRLAGQPGTSGEMAAASEENQ